MTGTTISISASGTRSEPQTDADPRSCHENRSVPHGRYRQNAPHPLVVLRHPCRANPRAAYDPVAVDVLKQLDFDFSEIRRSFKEYGQVCCLAREMNIDRTVRDFLARHPEGTIINLGCGLSTAVYRKPPAEAVWYDVDLPEVIRARQALLPPAKGHRLLAPGHFRSPLAGCRGGPGATGRPPSGSPECSTISPRT